MIVSGSMKVPMISRTICMKIRMTILGRSAPTANWTRPELAPLKASIWEKVRAPVIIMNIMTVTWRVEVNESFVKSQLNPR